jgi:hypothetical protein
MCLRVVDYRKLNSLEIINIFENYTRHLKTNIRSHNQLKSIQKINNVIVSRLSISLVFEEFLHRWFHKRQFISYMFGKFIFTKIIKEICDRWNALEKSRTRMPVDSNEINTFVCSFEFFIDENGS